MFIETCWFISWAELTSAVRPWSPAPLADTEAPETKSSLFDPDLIQLHIASPVRGQTSPLDFHWVSIAATHGVLSGNSDVKSPKVGLMRPKASSWRNFSSMPLAFVAGKWVPIFMNHKVCGCKGAHCWLCFGHNKQTHADFGNGRTLLVMFRTQQTNTRGLR